MMSRIAVAMILAGALAACSGDGEDTAGAVTVNAGAGPAGPDTSTVFQLKPGQYRFVTNQIVTGVDGLSGDAVEQVKAQAAGKKTRTECFTGQDANIDLEEATDFNIAGCKTTDLKVANGLFSARLACDASARNQSSTMQGTVDSEGFHNVALADVDLPLGNGENAVVHTQFTQDLERIGDCPAS
jgi:hypothetical protein